MSRTARMEKFFEALISGDRRAARGMVEDCLVAQLPAKQILDRLIWPALTSIDKLHRQDQLAELAHNYAIRLLRMLVDQLQPHLEVADDLGRSAIVLCGPQEPNELAGQIASDLLESRGFTVRFAGSGVTNEELIQQIGKTRPSVLMVFSSAPSDLPYLRLLIDELQESRLGEATQIAVGGGVFARADGLAEEIGADLWADTPFELIQRVVDQPNRRADETQRTVGKNHRKQMLKNDDQAVA